MALAVCADFSQPSHPAHAARAGARLYIASALIGENGYPADSALLAGHAREHGMGVLLANHGGPTGGWKAAGRSAFWNERGDLLCQGRGKRYFCWNGPREAGSIVATRDLLMAEHGKVLIFSGKFCHSRETGPMSTMNISLPDTLKSFVDEQVSQRGYGTSSEYVRELIRKDQDRQRLRGLLIAGAESMPAAPADDDYFESLRRRVHKARG